MTRDVRVRLDSDADLIVARRHGRELAIRAGFDPTDVVLVVTAISELARNVLLYAGHGEIGLTLIDDAGKRGIVVTAVDQGPGIPDVAQALEDGYSTSGGLGLGLPGVKRIMDELDIVSRVGRGTTVVAKKWTR